MNNQQLKSVLSSVMAAAKSPEVFWESLAELRGDPAEQPAAKAPKEKRAPSAYVLFSSRVGALIHTQEAEKPKEEKSRQPVIMQFTSPLWEEAKSGKAWSDEDILQAWSTFVPPEHSKQFLAGKNVKSKPEGFVAPEAKPKPAKPAAESSADEGEAAAKKPRKPQSEETKAAAAVKRAANKAAKAAAAAGGGGALPAVAGLQGGWAEAETE
jgi:hypothetical protein